MSFGGALLSDESITQASGAGVIMAFLFIVGSAFAIKIPKVSIVVFAIGAFLGIVVGANTVYTDLVVWGVASTILSVLSFFGHRSLKRDKFI